MDAFGPSVDDFRECIFQELRVGPLANTWDLGQTLSDQEGKTN